MKHSALYLLTAFSLVAAALTTSCRRQPASADAENERPKFHCPMHPTYVSPRQGDCPICNMKLTPIDTASTPQGDTAAPVAQRVTLSVSPDRQQQIGLRTALVQTQHLTVHLRTPGVVQHDETALARIAPRVGGWVRQLHVNFTGQAVEAGQPLLTLYSPELLVAERDYLLARQQYQALPTSASDQRNAARQLLETARQRLRLWEISDEEITALEQRGQPSDELLLRSPITGHVISKTAVAGRAFMPGESLFEIGQLQRLWVLAAVPETDLPRLRVDQPARILFPQLDNRAINTTVRFLSPHLDPQTRRGEARLEIENPDHLIRPNMWATVEFEIDLGPALAVPASAILDTGNRTLAFVARPDHHLEPREVRIGTRTDDWWSVLEGLQAGENVVTRALFLIDSESQLKAAIAALSETSTHAAH